MKANDGTGNHAGRDTWETDSTLWDQLHQQYSFTFDCCATQDTTKLKRFSKDFESVQAIKGVAWMNPPFSIARQMFEHYFKVVTQGVAIFRCDNMETKQWQEVILPNADWVFIPKGRVNYEGMVGAGARFPSALIGVGVEPPKDIEGFTLKVIQHE